MKKEKKFRFIIVSPRQYSGGAIVLHLLCKLLQENGYSAKIFYTMIPVNFFKNKKKLIWFYYIIFLVKDFIKIICVKLFPKYVENKSSSSFIGYDYCAVRGCKRKFLPFYDKKNTIVVYPESVYGNFLKSIKTVRWFLYYNPFKNDNNAYGEKDLFICYRKIFNDIDLNPTEKTVCLSNFDYDLYKQTNFGSRQGSCFIIRKGKNRSDLPKVFDGVIIDNLSERKKVEVFNNCEYCISYDTQTFYTTIAALCGCKTIIIPENGKNRTDYIKDGESKFGVAFGFENEEIKYAQKTQILLEKTIKEYLIANKIALDDFLSYVNEYF